MRTLRAGQVLPSSWISVSHVARPAGFSPGELDWPGTWTDRAGRDRTPSVPGHELSGVVVELGYGTTGLTVGQRVFGLTDWTRNGSLAEYTAVEARNLAPLAADIDHTVAAALPISGLTETAAAFARHRRSPGKTIIQVAHDLEGNERSRASREVAPRDSEPGVGQRRRTPMTPSPSIPRTR